MKSTIERTDIEELLRILGEESPVGICIIQDGRFCYANPSFPLITGYAADELVGKDCLEIVVPEDKTMVRENAVEMLKGKLTTPYEFRVICKDGSIRWVMETVRSIQYHGRRATLGNYMDVSDRRQAEQALRKSEERYRKVFEEALDAIFIADAETGVLIDCNHAACELVGAERSELIGKHQRILHPPEQSDGGFSRTFSEHLHTKEGKVVETQVITKKGEIKDVAVKANLLEFDGRKALQGIFHDITERKEAEAALRRSEERYRTMLEETEDAYFEVDLGGHFTFVNSSTCRQLGYTKEELIGMSYKKATLEDDIDFVLRVFNEVYRTGKPNKGCLWTMICKDGTQKLVEHFALPIRNDKGEIIGFRGVGRDIAEYRQAEEALRAERNKLQSLMDAIEYALTIQDKEHTIIYQNEPSKRRFGNCLGNTCYRVFHKGQGRICDDCPVEKAFQDGKPHTVERQNATPSGEIVYLEETASPIKDTAGSIISCVELITDITARRQAEQSLRESEEFSTGLLDNAPNPIIVIDPGTSIRYVNPAFEEMTGFSLTEISGVKAPYPWWPEEMSESYSASLEGIVSKGRERFENEQIMQNRKGERFWVRLDSSSIMLQGKVKYYIANWVDITERKQVEEKLRQSEENYKALFDNTVVGTVLLDAETMGMAMVNQAAAEMFGFSSVEEALRAHPLDFIHPEDKRRVSELIKKNLIEGQSRQTYELRAVTKDGREIWISATGARIVRGDSRFAGLISFTDITEQKRQREQLMMTDRLASLGELLSGTAHELNNPLTSITGFSQLLLEKEVPDDIRENLKLIYDEAQRAVTVTKDLLTFARKHASVRQRNQINDIIQDVLKLRAYEHKVNSIKVDRRLASNLPEIMVDYFQIQQVFMNIIINAEYFVTEAHGKGTLTITTKRLNDTILISLADDGPGIRREDLRRIFDPFFTTKETGKGTGLGLSICHGIVTEHGGQLYARSEPGKGATFFVELPISDG
jgi:two-component system NtrC family sensor kinase